VSVPSARLFFALWPDPSMQRALADAASSTVQHALDSDAGVRPVPASNFHLTLVFLGSVPLGRLSAVELAAARCVGAAGSDEVEVVLDAIEHWRKPQILCAVARATPVAASRLAESLEQSLTAEGFTPDLKLGFRAHATLARRVRHTIPAAAEMQPQTWRFRTFALVESKTRPAGSIYTVVSTYPLA
jgi:2'-5' RNA ligase